MYALRHSFSGAIVRRGIAALVWTALAALSSACYAQSSAPGQSTNATQPTSPQKGETSANKDAGVEAAKKQTDAAAAETKKKADADAAETKKKADADALEAKKRADADAAEAKKNTDAQAAEAKKKADADAAKLAAANKVYADTLCSPSGLTSGTTDVAKLSSALAGIKQSTIETRVELSRPYIPDSGVVELLLFRPFSGDEKMAYRAFFVASTSPNALSAVETTQIQAEPATPVPPATGTDFKYGETTVPKTLLRFSETVPSGSWWYPWQKARVHVVGCAAPGASFPVAFLASTDTVVATTSECAWIAIVLSIAFYVLAAAASNYVRRVFREVGMDKLPKNTGSLVGPRPTHSYDGRPIMGTNYAGFWRHLNPVVLSAGINGRGNASKLQILFFSILVFGLVSYMWMRTGHVSGISQNVLLLMGISGVGATAAAGTDVAKNRLKFENYAWLINRGWLPRGGIGEVNMAEWKDIFTANGEFDPFRFQMVTFSVFVGASLVGAAMQLDDLTNFAIPDSLLGILGLSQGVYVAGKLVAPPTMSELDAQLDKVKDAEATLRADLDKLGPSALRGVVLAFKEDDGIKKVRASADVYRQCWNLARTMFESTLGPLVDKDAADRAPPFPVPFLFQDEPIKFVVEPDVPFKIQLATTGQVGSVKWSRAENQRWPETFAITDDGQLSAPAGQLDSAYDFVLTAVDDGRVAPGTKAADDSDAKDGPFVALTRRFVLRVQKFDPK
jgi:hypothetical protein